MDLRTYISGLPRGGVTAFAQKIGLKSAIYLHQLASRQDNREASPALSVVIERESCMQVRRWDLRPADWHLIWPELIGAEGAPEIQAVEAKAA